MSIDMLQEKIRKLKNPTIIEFGVTPEHLPQHLLDEEGSVHLAYRRFCSELMEKLRGFVPGVRFSFASFALMGPEGLNSLTMLLNKDAGRRQAEEYIEGFNGKANCALLIIDLDNFKQVNDRYGHLFGDAALSRAAREIQRLFRNQDIIARIGGDEFIMMIASDEKDFETQIRNNIKNAFAELNESSGKPFYVEASIGVKAFVCEEEFDFSGILQQSDKVMYESKKKRRASVLREENR